MWNFTRGSNTPCAKDDCAGVQYKNFLWSTLLKCYIYAMFFSGHHPGGRVGFVVQAVDPHD